MTTTYRDLLDARAGSESFATTESERGEIAEGSRIQGMKYRRGIWIEKEKADHCNGRLKQKGLI